MAWVEGDGLLDTLAGYRLEGSQVWQSGGGYPGKVLMVGRLDVEFISSTASWGSSEGTAWASGLRCNERELGGRGIGGDMAGSQTLLCDQPTQPLWPLGRLAVRRVRVPKLHGHHDRCTTT